jgi:hypothetical protein
MYYKFNVGQKVQVVSGSDEGKVVEILRCYTPPLSVFKWDDTLCPWYSVAYLDEQLRRTELTANFSEGWLRRYVL